MRELLDDAAHRAWRYLETLGDRSVAPSPAALERLGELAGSLPVRPGSPADTLRLLDEIAGPATMATAGGRFFGFVIGGALPVTVASHWLATAWDQNAAFHGPGAAVATLEAT